MKLKENKGMTLIVFTIILAVLIVVAGGVIVYLLKNPVKENVAIQDQTGTQTNTDNNQDDVNRNIIQENNHQTENNKSVKRVGNDEFGYITIPDNWYKFIDINNNNVLQYSYANIYIVTLYAVDTSQISAYQYASNVMYGVKAEGVQDVKGATVNIGKYTAYQVYCYYELDNTWFVSWFFEAEDGKTHYISVEGPDPTNECFLIPNTFSLIK